MSAQTSSKTARLGVAALACAALIGVTAAAFTPVAAEAKTVKKRKHALQASIVLRELDLDRDGALSRAEFSVLGVGDFDKIDRNADGALSHNEIRRSHRRYIRAMRRSFRSEHRLVNRRYIDRMRRKRARD